MHAENLELLATAHPVVTSLQQLFLDRFFRFICSMHEVKENIISDVSYLYIINLYEEVTILNAGASEKLEKLTTTIFVLLESVLG
jgi:hypothetical protein